MQAIKAEIFALLYLNYCGLKLLILVMMNQINVKIFKQI